MFYLNNRRILLIALILAALAAFITYRFISGSDPAFRREVPVLVAAQDIPIDTVITGEMVAVRHIPEDFVHPRALRSAEEAIGKASKAPLLKDEQILTGRVASLKQPDDRFSYRIAMYQRAVTLDVSEASGVAGFPTVGDHVDIIIISETEEEDSTYTATTLQNKKILAAGEVTTPQEDGKQQVVSTVTLSVTQEEAQALALAENSGSIKLTLRSPLDKEETPVLETVSVSN